MKFPKDKNNLFVVERWMDGGSVLVGGASSMERADEVKEMFEQQWKDAVGNLEGVSFDIAITTFYG